MKKTIATLALALMATTAQAETAYNYKNPAHKADNTCVGVLSLARDALFNEVQVKDGMAFVKIVEPTAELVAFRNKVTELQNSYILKYEYSKQFNTHYKVAKMLTQQRTNEKGSTYFANELKKCM